MFAGAGKDRWAGGPDETSPLHAPGSCPQQVAFLCGHRNDHRSDGLSRLVDQGSLSRPGKDLGRVRPVVTPDGGARAYFSKDLRRYSAASIFIGLSVHIA